MKKYSSGAEFLYDYFKRYNIGKNVPKPFSPESEKKFGDFTKFRRKEIEQYMERLLKDHNMLNEIKSSEKSNETHEQTTSENVILELFKNIYYSNLVIKESEINEHVIELIKRQYFAENKEEISEEKLQSKINSIIINQKNSLDSWLDFIISSDSARFPMWAKYWVFHGVTSIGGINSEDGSFKRRRYDTVAPFIELNHEALTYTLEFIVSRVENNELSEKELESLSDSLSFASIYFYYLSKIRKEKSNSNSTEGVWVKYEQGKEYGNLHKSLQGKMTSWCIAAEGTCKSYVEEGDFYIYYTLDENNEYTIPRIAIRMLGKNQIAEIKGVANSQEVEESMLMILKEKMSEFSDCAEYLRKQNNKEEINRLEKKYNNNEDFSLEEIEFLNGFVDTFGFQTDERITKIRESIKIENVMSAYNVSRDQIATKLDELNENTIVYYGSLNLEENNVYYPNLTYITGDAALSRLESAKGLPKLKRIGANASFYGLKSAEGLENLESIKGYAVFSSLINSKGLESLKTINGYADFSNLTESTSLNSLKSIEGNANFSSLKTSAGLRNLERIEGDAIFKSLESSEELSKLERISGSAIFTNLKISNGLGALKRIIGNADFSSLKDAKNLSNLILIGNDANFNLLESSEGLNSLVSIKGNANFENLTNATFLTNLEYIGANANFHFLSNGTGLENLKIIGNNADFSCLNNIIKKFQLTSLTSVGGTLKCPINSSEIFPNLIVANEEELKNEEDINPSMSM